MDMPKQMDAGATDETRGQQQGQMVEAKQEKRAQNALAETPAEQMRPMHFSDWASI